MMITTRISQNIKSMNVFIRLSTVFVFLCFSLIAAGQPEGVTVNDTLSLEIRNSQVQLEYFSKPDFDYTKELAKEPVTFWEKLKYWLFKILNSIFNEPVLETIFYVIVIGFIVFLIIKLMGYRYSGFWLHKKHIRGVAGETYDEKILTLDFDKAVREALEKEDYRAAVRFQYLKLLKEFADNKIIAWEPDKTNREYQAEISRHGLGPSFEKVTRVYEYVWYGDFELKRDTYEKTADDFEVLRLNIPS
jgi:hypothetical protein